LVAELVGAVALLQMRSINASTIDIASNWLPSVRTIGELRAAGITYRTVIRQYMLSFTAEEKQAMEKTLETVTANVNKARAAYEKLISAPEERALYAEWSQLWEEYVRGTQQVLAKSRTDIGKVSDEVRELNMKVVNPVGVKADAVLAKSIELNDKGGEAASLDAQSTFTTALYTLIAIIAVAAVFGSGVGVGLIRDVSRGINSITEPMQALGRGDLTATVPHQGEKTEIGAMADVLQVFKQALIDKRAADQAAAQVVQERGEDRHARVIAVLRQAGSRGPAHETAPNSPRMDREDRREDGFRGPDAFR